MIFKRTLQTSLLLAGFLHAGDGFAAAGSQAPAKTPLIGDLRGLSGSLSTGAPLSAAPARLSGASAAAASVAVTAALPLAAVPAPASSLSTDTPVAATGSAGGLVSGEAITGQLVIVPQGNGQPPLRFIMIGNRLFDAPPLPSEGKDKVASAAAASVPLPAAGSSASPASVAAAASAAAMGASSPASSAGAASPESEAKVKRVGFGPTILKQSTLYTALTGHATPLNQAMMAVFGEVIELPSGLNSVGRFQFIINRTWKDSTTEDLLKADNSQLPRDARIILAMIAGGYTDRHRTDAGSFFRELVKDREKGGIRAEWFSALGYTIKAYSHKKDRF